MKPDLKMVILDPLNAFLGSDTDSHKGASVRGALTPFLELANRYRFAIVGVMHLNKKEDSKMIHRILGSTAFAAACRAAWLLAKDESDKTRRIFIPIKNNLVPRLINSLSPKTVVFFLEKGFLSGNRWAMVTG